MSAQLKAFHLLCSKNSFINVQSGVSDNRVQSKNYNEKARIKIKDLCKEVFIMLFGIVRCRNVLRVRDHYNELTLLELMFTTVHTIAFC